MTRGEVQRAPGETERALSVVLSALREPETLHPTDLELRNGLLGIPIHYPRMPYDDVVIEGWRTALLGYGSGRSHGFRSFRGR